MFKVSGILGRAREAADDYVNGRALFTETIEALHHNREALIAWAVSGPSADYSRSALLHTLDRLAAVEAAVRDLERARDRLTQVLITIEQ